MTTARVPSEGRRKLVDELVRKARVLALVNGVLRTTIAAGSLPEVLMALAPNLKEICPFDLLSVALYDARRRIFHIPYAYLKAKVSETGEAPRAWADTPLAKAVETRKPYLRRDVPKERGFSTDTATLKRGMACEAIFPLFAGEQVFGTFQVGCLEADRIREEHVRLVEDLAPAVASAVHRFAGIIPG